MSLYVVRAFVQLGELLSSNTELATYDEAISAMLSAIRQLMAPPPSKRRGIGFTADIGEKK